MEPAKNAVSRETPAKRRNDQANASPRPIAHSTPSAIQGA